MSKSYFWINDFGHPIKIDGDVKELEKQELQDKEMYESVTITRLPKDIRISNQNPRKIRDRIYGRKPRGKITKYSASSQRRFEVVARNTCDKLGVFITLTYPNNYPIDGEVVKNHLHTFLIYLGRKGYQYLWTLEFQKRGAPHFHILVDKKIPYEWVAETWYNIVDSKDPKHLEAGTRVEAVKNREAMGKYITHYMKKWQQKIVPEEYQKVGRFWGRSRKLLEIKKEIYFGYWYPMKIFRKEQRVFRKWTLSKTKYWKKKKFKNPYVQKNACINIVNADVIAKILADNNIHNYITDSEFLGLS